MSEAPGPAELATTQLLPFLAKGGNEEAWRIFVVRYRPRILRWCHRLQADDAEEIASRVLHKLVVGLARGVYRRHDPGTFRGWLRRVVGNEVVDFARRQRSSQPAGDVLQRWPDPVSIDELAGELDEEFRADCERAEQVCARVRGRVQPHTWEAFTRTFLQGQEIRDVARELGLTLSGVYKARDRVRRLLEEEGQAEPLPSVENGTPPMSTHLCDERISQLLHGTLPDDELVQAEAHLWECSDCRDALQRRTEPMPDLPPLAAPRSEDAAPRSALPAVPGYEILGELGRGGMAVVYQARQLQPNRIVALKMIRAIEHAGPTDRLRFQIETEAVARLQHPHIVQLYEAGEVRGQPFFSLEFCDGGTLAHQWKKQRPSPREAAALIETLARAMHYAHLRGVVHRDLKPGNVLLAGPERVAKITDFGLAKRIDAQARDLSQSGAIMGTASYMAPEQAAGKVHDTGPATDVYGLGTLLYECLTDQPPFHAETTLETMQQVLEREPLPPSRLGARIPRDLETICLKCLNKVPARRYASAEDLADDLRRFQSGEPIRARAVGAAERTWKWARRRPALSALLGVVLLAMVCLSALSVVALDREHKAQREADKAGKARDFLVRIFRIKDIRAGNTTTARQIINEAEQRIPIEFADQPELRDELLSTIENVNRNLDRTIPAAMILVASGAVTLRSVGGDGARPVPQMLLYPDDRLALSADAHVQIVFMSNLHQERLEPGREATIGRTGCLPPDAVGERFDSVLMTFVRLPKGTFYMGWDGKPGSAKMTQIKEDFEIALHDVTQGQWEAIMGNNPSWFSRASGGRNWVIDISDEELKLFPVENVSWDDAQQFIKKLNEKEAGRGYLYRMPTEAEWEYACRAGATSKEECSYHFYFDKPTNDLSSQMANFNGNEPFGKAPAGPWLMRPTRVGAYPSNRLGLCDMHGNVWQWTDTANASGRVDRGGSWRDSSRSCRAGEPGGLPPSYQNMNVGFRLARVPVNLVREMPEPTPRPKAATSSSPSPAASAPCTPSDRSEAFPKAP